MICYPSALLILIESFGWDLVQMHNCLVGITHDDVLAVFLLLKQLDEHSEDTPHLSLLQRDLLGEVDRAVELRRQNDVIRGILRVGPTHKADLHLIGTRQDRLCRPLGQLERIVLEFRGQNGTALRIDLVPPTGGRRATGRHVLVQGKGGHVLGLLDETVEFGTNNHRRLVVQCKFAIPKGHTGREITVAVTDL